MITIKDIPKNVREVLCVLYENGYKGHVVGGAVRDVYLKRHPKDWDVATDALPEQIQSLFPKTVYENNFGTVFVVFENKDISEDMKSLSNKNEIIDVTPYRLEGEYSDKRHPDQVSFTTDVLYDLKRRDFTINSIAVSFIENAPEIIDPYDGEGDIKRKLIKAVGNPTERFEEDALRILRAIRFSVELGFVIENETGEAMLKNKELVKELSAERVREEFIKIIMSPDPMLGIALMEQYGILEYVIPELRAGIGCEQGGAHKYNVFEHLLQALDHAAKKGWPLEIRLAALFHDIGKPKSRRTTEVTAKKNFDSVGAPAERVKLQNFSLPKRPYTFYGHEVIGARMAKVILERLRFPSKTIELVVKLVRYHMFFSDTEQITLSAVRRVIQNIGVDHIWELMQIRECDRVGMAKKEAPYRLRKYHAMIEEALRDPISVSQLKVNGKVLMDELNIKPGPRMGWMLHALLEEVLDDPTKNTREYLDAQVKQLDTLSDKELKKLGEEGKQKKDELEEEEIGKLHEKHGVRK